MKKNNKRISTETKVTITLGSDLYEQLVEYCNSVGDSFAEVIINALKEKISLDMILFGEGANVIRDNETWEEEWSEHLG